MNWRKTLSSMDPRFRGDGNVLPVKNCPVHQRISGEDNRE